MNLKKLLAFCMALILFVSLWGCSSPATTQEETGIGYKIDTLRLEGGTDWGVPSPYLNVSRGPGTAKMRLVFASLLEKDEEKDVSWLAESWSIEGNTYTFQLFENAKFHDGTPLTAEDVAFTIDYSRKFPPVNNSLGTGEGFLVDSYEILSPTTIAMTVQNPTADTLSALGSFVILPKHIWEKVEDPYTFMSSDNLIGSGAYKLDSYDSATGSYAFSAFEGWCNGKAAAKQILFVPVSDPLLAFQNREIHITSMPADLSETYLNHPEVGLVEKTNDTGYKLLINFEKCPAFLDLTLRQGVYAALDRQAMVDKVFRGMGSVGSAGYVPRGTQFYNGEVTEYPYEPEKAKEIFAGKGLSVSLLLSDSADDIAMAELIRNDLEAAGITVSTVSYDSATRDAMINEGNYEFAIVSNGGWGNNPPTYMRTIFSDISKNKGGNPHSMGPIGYSNEEITALCENQVYETDFAARKAMFGEIQKLVSQEIPLIVLANKSSYSMYWKEAYDGWMKTYAYAQCEQNRLSFMDR